MIVADHNGITQTSRGDLNFSGDSHVVKLKEGESLTIQVSNSNKSHVGIKVAGGELVFAEPIPREKNAENIQKPQDSLTTIPGLSDVEQLSVRDLQKQGAINAYALAGWTFDSVEAMCGIEFATKAQNWLKSLGLTMRCQ